MMISWVQQLQASLEKYRISTSSMSLKADNFVFTKTIYGHRVEGNMSSLAVWFMSSEISYKDYAQCCQIAENFATLLKSRGEKIADKIDTDTAIKF